MPSLALGSVGSPDRADALIWALSELFPRIAVNDALFEQVKVIANGPLMRF